MNSESPRIRSLIRQAERNVEAGKFAAAEAVYRQIVEEAPENSTAWLGLAQVTKDPEEQEAAFEQVLALDKENDIAQAGLKTLHENEQNNSLVNIHLEQNVNTRETPFLDYTKVPAPEKVKSGVEEGDLALVGAAADSVGHDPFEDHDHHSVEATELELYCYRHPDRQTSLRCYKCNNPICSECTVKTPVGYLCPTCHREAEDAFFNNKTTDYLLAALVALPLSLITGWFVVRFSGGIFMILIFIFVGGAVGGFIARLSKRVINKRRGRFIPHVVAGCIVLGVLVWAWPWLLVLFAGGAGVLFKLAGIGVYLFTAASSAYYWAR